MSEGAPAFESQRLRTLKRYVSESMYSSSSTDPAHGLDHVMRVYDAGMQIGKEEGADLDVLGASLLLHDSVRPTSEEGEKNHAYTSADTAVELLPKFGYSQPEVSSVKEAIITSSRSGGSGEVPPTLEAKIVYDADKLDGGGKVGVERTQKLWKARSKEKGKPYDEKEAMRWYLGRILDVLNFHPPFTDSARRLMEERVSYSFEYVKKVLGEEFYDITQKDLRDKSWLGSTEE